MTGSLPVVKKKGGRPKLNIDPKIILNLAMIHCTVQEIASIVGCSHETIYARFSDVLRKGHDEGQMSLKRKMHEKALAGDTPMLIWLSKQRLGYRDKQPDDVAITNFNVFVNEVPK